VRLGSHIGAARRAWDVALAGLAFWEAARSGAPSAIHAPDLDRGRAHVWSRAVHSAQRHLRVGADGRLDDAQIDWLVARTGDGADLDELHGCLFGLDHSNADAFVDAWRPAAGDEVLLAAGDVLPVPDMLWPTLDRSALVSRPSSVVQPDDGDLPHVRRYRPLHLAGRTLEVVVDFEWEAELQEVLLPAFTAAAGHPYADLAEFRGVDGTANFPIRPRRSTPAVDCARDTLATGATVIVLPELHVDARALRRIAALMADHDEPCLMIAGSRHDDTGGRKLNIATGLFAGVDEPLVHTKLSRAISPYAPGGPVFELIDQPDPLRLRVWQAGPLRVAVLICKDVLDFPLAQHLAHLGVNVLFGPAMSGRTDAFRSHADWLMSDAQCVSVIVNGPLAWGGRAPGPSSLMTRPLASDACCDHHRAAPGVDLLHLDPQGR
jgi:hypothetical protein